MCYSLSEIKHHTHNNKAFPLFFYKKKGFRPEERRPISCKVFKSVFETMPNRLLL
jgi:hypothetical protein